MSTGLGDNLLASIREALKAERDRGWEEAAVAIDGLKRERLDLATSRDMWKARCMDAEKALEAYQARHAPQAKQVAPQSPIDTDGAPGIGFQRE